MSIPTTDDRVLDFCTNFHAVAASAPAEFGLTATRLEQYLTSLNRYSSALAVAKATETRTRIAIELKNSAKATLLRSTRSLVNVCEMFPEMTDAKRLQLGITVRKPRQPSKLPGQPFVKVMSVNGREVKLSIQQSEKTKGKPKKVVGANIMVAYGELPTSTGGWSFVTGTGRSTTTVFLDGVEEATTAYITAFWFNGRKETGPAANPVSVNLAATTPLPVKGKMKIAA
jgi:hypothetical protein